MKPLATVLCLLVASVSASRLPAANLMTGRSEVSLANFLMQQQAQDAISTDPTGASQCFNIYLPLLSSVATQWSTDYEACITTSNNDRDTIMTEMKKEQDAMSTSASGVCEFITNCESITDTMDFFNCFSSFGTNVMTTVYAISNNASDDATTLFDELQVVDENMYKCTNESERSYVEKTTNVYEALNYCLLNGVPPVVDVTTTTETPVETTIAPVETTVAPVETTAAPVETTVVPVETTVAPVETTVAPVETTAVPVETTVAPVETTVVPVETTVAPVETTVAPVETTVAPVETTVAPVETTVAPVETTSADEVSTIVADGAKLNTNSVLASLKKMFQS